MPASLTLKNLPDEVYARLKDSARAHRRSLNREAIVCLEAALMPRRIEADERLARARPLREPLSKGAFGARDIEGFKREGRPRSSSTATSSRACTCRAR